MLCDWETVLAKKPKDEEAQEHLPVLDGKVPPESTEAEQAVLGSMLMEKDAIVRAVGMLEARDFYSPQHQLLFTGMLDLFRENRPVDIVTLQAWLGPERTADISTKYLNDLQEVAPTAAAIREYARQVRRSSVYRQQATAIQSYQQKPDEPRRMALMESLEAGGDDATIWLSIDELLRRDMKVEWLVERLIPLQAVTCIIADWHMGKSWLALSLCHSIASGGKWLGHYPILREGGALYVDAEMGEAAVRERMAAFDLGMGRPLPTKVVEVATWDEEEVEAASTPEDRVLHITWFPRWHLGPAVGALEAKIRETKARVVVFDSVFGMAGPGEDLYQPGVWLKIMPPLRRLAHKTFCAVILLHHLRKSSAEGDNTVANRAFGSVAAMAEVDSVIAISGDRKSATKVVSHEKYRLSPAGEPSFFLNFQAGQNGNGMLLLKGEAVPDQEAEGRERVKEVLLAFTADGHEHSRKELLGIVKGAITDEGDRPPSDRMIDNALRELVASNELDKPKSGFYQRPEAAAWE